jgi:hypothetical protein
MLRRLRRSGTAAVDSDACPPHFQRVVGETSGADYWAQLNPRDGPDAGTIIGVAGVQGALSSRVSLFLEGRYGAALQKNDDDVRATRIVGQLGVRLKF